MKIFVLCSYTDALNDPVISRDYDKIYENMEYSYHMVLEGVDQVAEEKENTYIEGNSAQAVVHGAWMEWRITELELPVYPADLLNAALISQLQSD